MRVDVLARGTGPRRIVWNGGEEGEMPSLRAVLLYLVEEYARHDGHADLVRESVDGLVGEDPPGVPDVYPLPGTTL